MSIWIILWLVLSGGIFYFMIWNFYILYQQKTAWKAFAEKNKLRYRTDKMLSSPQISGVIENQTISFFTGEHLMPDQRTTRKLTAIEIALSGLLPNDSAIASGGLVDLVRDFNLKEEYKPKHADWKDEYIAASDNKAVLNKYMTKERMDALSSLMKIKNSWVILISRGGIFLLRIDLPEPLHSDKKLNALSKKMIRTAQILNFKPGEQEQLQSVKAMKNDRTQALDVSEEKIDSISGLELEDDEVEKVEKNKKEDQE